MAIGNLVPSPNDAPLYISRSTGRVYPGSPGGGGDLPPGGTVEQVLTKTSSADSAATWQDPTWIVAKATPPTAADYGLTTIPVGAIWVETP